MATAAATVYFGGGFTAVPKLRPRRAHGAAIPGARTAARLSAVLARDAARRDGGGLTRRDPEAVGPLEQEFEASAARRPPHGERAEDAGGGDDERHDADVATTRS